jgi:hypothetical protein
VNWNACLGEELDIEDIIRQARDEHARGFSQPKSTKKIRQHDLVGSFTTL